MSAKKKVKSQYFDTVGCEIKMAPNPNIDHEIRYHHTCDKSSFLSFVYMVYPSTPCPKNYFDMNTQPTSYVELECSLDILGPISFHL